MARTNQKTGRRLFRRQEKSLVDVPRSWVLGWIAYLRARTLLCNVEKYCMFVGYPRSGHTLIGSLLNAHPEILIAHEVNALRYVNKGFSRRSIYGLLLRRDREFGRLGREWSRYDYTVPGQYQGRFTTLRVIGDKRGRASTNLLGQHPDLLERLRARVRVPLRVIHHVRNPFDNIATMALKGDDSLDIAADRYFRFVDWSTCALKRLGDDESINSYHENLIRDPSGEVGRLVDFLELESSEEYLRACDAKVFPSANRSRDRVEWPSGLVDEVEGRMRRYPHLQRYGFAD